MGSIITSDLVPIETRGTYQSYINIIYGVGSALGAATGGAIADSLGWRWEFGFQVPFLSVCLLLGIFTVPGTLGLEDGVEIESLSQAMKKFDYKGSILLTISVTALILGLVSFSNMYYHSMDPTNQRQNLGGNVYPWSHPMVISVSYLKSSTLASPDSKSPSSYSPLDSPYLSSLKPELQFPSCL